MTDFEFTLFWGLCLLAMVVFMAFIGVLEVIQRKKDRERDVEAYRLRRAYENKKRWEQNMIESEKLFEGVKNVK